MAKSFEFGNYNVELFGEAFNLLDEEAFNVGGSQAEFGNSEFGIADNQAVNQQQFQWGVRFSMD